MLNLLTMIVTGVAAATSLLLLGCLWWQLYLSHQQMRRFMARLARASSVIRKQQAEFQEFRHKKKLVEDSVDSGATAVEAVHRLITSSTFGMLDRLATSDSFRDNVKQVRMVHDETSRAFYRSLRSTNKTLHALTNLVVSHRRRINPDER